MVRKVSIIGAGAVGATLAQRVLESGLADVVLIDILKNLACGKAFDLLDAAAVVGHERNIIGTDDYSHIKSSDIVVITAGLARKPGMSREDLVAKNAAIVGDVAKKVKEHSPGAIVIVVTNPLDAMTYLTWKVTGFKRERVIGMAGLLDGSRFAQLVAAELKVPRSSIETYMLGSHGDTMLAVLSQTRIDGKPIKDMLAKDVLEKLVARARDRGAEIVGLFGTGSAYYSPSAATFKMIDHILNDTKTTVVASVCLNGEYGLHDITIGVPCKIGAKGIEEIIVLPLSDDEKSSFLKSAQAIKKSIELLK